MASPDAEIRLGPIKAERRRSIYTGDTYRVWATDRDNSVREITFRPGSGTAFSQHTEAGRRNLRVKLLREHGLTEQMARAVTGIFEPNLQRV